MHRLQQLSDPLDLPVSVMGTFGDGDPLLGLQLDGLTLVVELDSQVPERLPWPAANIEFHRPPGSLQAFGGGDDASADPVRWVYEISVAASFMQRTFANSLSELFAD